MTDEELIASLWLDSADKAKIMRHIREAELRGVKAGLEAAADRLERIPLGDLANVIRAIDPATVEVG